jgi:protein MpaA
MVKNKSLCIVPLLIALLASGCSSWFTTDQEDYGINLYDEIIESELPWKDFATSVEGRDIYMLELGQGDSTTIIFGGFHGNEMAGVELVYRFAEYLFLYERNTLNCRVVIIPVLNPDGLVQAKRGNANNVDVNRNFPTENWDPGYRNGRNRNGSSPASEPETQVVIGLLEKYSPQRILTVHTQLEVVNYDGPATALAEKMAIFNNYPVSSDIGYATPGSFGTYAGKERMIPTVTLELSGGSCKDIWLANRLSLMMAVEY